MKEKGFIRWSKFRKIGKFKCGLLFGAGFIVLAVVFDFLESIIEHGPIFNFEYISLYVIMYGGLGLFVGLVLWEDYEEKYSKYISK